MIIFTMICILLEIFILRARGCNPIDGAAGSGNGAVVAL